MLLPVSPVRTASGGPIRRQSERYVLQQSLRGDLTLFHDVTIDNCSASSVWVRSLTRLPDDQVVALAIGGRGDTRHRVRVAVAVPSLSQGTICHRIRLEASPPLPEQFASTLVGRNAWIWHHVPIRVAEISRGGCRLESPTPLASGRIVQVAMALDTRAFADDGRVAWCRVVEGGSVYLIGVETLAAPRTTEAATAPLRDVLPSLDSLGA